MVEFWQKHKIYFLAFSGILLLAAGSLLLIEKGDLLLYFSNHRNSFNNYFFRFANTLGEGYAFVFFFLILLFFRLRYALGILLSGFSAMFLSHGLKQYFSHPRPSIYFSEILSPPIELITVPEVELLSSYTTSFPSGHTTAAFTLYSLLALYFPQRSWQLACIIMATLAALARVYLGQHFLEDITAGALCGLLIAIIIYSLQKKLKWYTWANSSLYTFNSNQQQPLKS